MSIGIRPGLISPNYQARRVLQANIASPGIASQRAAKPKVAFGNRFTDFFKNPTPDERYNDIMDIIEGRKKAPEVSSDLSLKIDICAELLARKFNPDNPKKSGWTDEQKKNFLKATKDMKLSKNHIFNKSEIVNHIGASIKYWAQEIKKKEGIN